MEKDNNISLNKKKYKVQSDVEVAFARLIGPLAIISVLDSYNEEHREIKKLLKIWTVIIFKFGMKFIHVSFWKMILKIINFMF